MDSVPLVCRLLFQDQSKLLEATHIDVEAVATRMMSIVGMLAVDEAEVETAFDVACVGRDGRRYSGLVLHWCPAHHSMLCPAIM